MQSTTPIYALFTETQRALSDIILPHDEFIPLPAIDDRNRWEAIRSDAKASLVDAGERAAAEPWSMLPASRYLDFSRDGNRSRFSRSYFARRRKLASLVLAECCENTGRFVDEIVDGIWLICEESSWCVPAHNYMQSKGNGLPDVGEPIVDLFAAETAALLAWVRFLVSSRLDSVSPLVGPRIDSEVTRRVIDPYLARDDFWWMGFGDRWVNNWNPWINSNVLTTVLLIEPDPRRREAAVDKSMRSIDRFLGPYPADGGCDEGPSYWGRAGASLFDYLELLSLGTDGVIDGFSLPIVAEIGKFIYRAHISGNQYVNFADAPAVFEPPADLIVRFGRAVGDRELERFGRWVGEQDGTGIDPGLSGSLGRMLPSLFWMPEPQDPDSPAPPLPRDVWLPEIQVMVARDTGGSNRGLFVAAKGGHNDESHNHNDIGNLVVYRDGCPVIVDAGVETYTRKTFSDDRYDIWTMQSAYHTLLPTIDGVMQSPGSTCKASGARHACNDEAAEFTLDIAGAYPEEAGIKRWTRRVVLDRGISVTVHDEYKLNRGATIEISLLTPCEISTAESGTITFSPRELPGGRSAGSAMCSFDSGALDLRIEDLAISDERMQRNWGEELKRVVFNCKTATSAGSFTFIVTPI